MRPFYPKEQKYLVRLCPHVFIHHMMIVNSCHRRLCHTKAWQFFFRSSQEVVCGFLREALAGCDTAVHTIFYEVDDEDGLIAIPGKYADRGKTAECLRQMAHAVNGRFHWYRSGGEFTNAFS